MTPYPAWFEHKIYNLLVKLGYRRRGLRQRLLDEDKTRWLDIGSHSFNPGFDCLDIVSADDIDPAYHDRYIQANLMDISESRMDAIGQYDLIRLQHVFEHFSFEDGEKLLRICARLLKDSGYLLMTVPDLRAHMRFYQRNYQTEAFRFFRQYAGQRLPVDAPASYLFSFHVHQFGHSPIDVPGQAHKWAYDSDGLGYALRRVGLFDDIRRLRLTNSLAEIPFTHKIPVEDLCFLARKA